jgi:hypothetical protein
MRAQLTTRTNADFFQPTRTVEYYLGFDGDPGFMSETNYANYKEAQAIKEQGRLTEQRQADERATQLQVAKDALPYSGQTAQEICEKIASGELLTVICLDANMPTPRRVTRWLKDHSDFAALYQCAINDRLSIFEEDLVALADSIPTEPLRATASSTKEKLQFVDPIQKAKLQIEVRMRWLKALRPQKWSEQSALIMKEADPYDVANLSADEIERRIAEIERKELIVRQGAR